eukprot:183170-Chlamydomonas_euryale.AAC.8
MQPGKGTHTQTAEPSQKRRRAKGCAQVREERQGLCSGEGGGQRAVLRCGRRDKGGAQGTEGMAGSGETGGVVGWSRSQDTKLACLRELLALFHTAIRNLGPCSSDSTPHAHMSMHGAVMRSRSP